MTQTDKYGENPQQIKVNGKRIPLDPKLIMRNLNLPEPNGVAKCKEWTKEAIPKIVLEKTGKPATQEFIDGATKTFGFWWLGTLEQIKRGQ